MPTSSCTRVTGDLHPERGTPKSSTNSVGTKGVETTTRAAAMCDIDIDVTVLADCCTTYSVEHQTSSLESLEFYLLAAVSTVDEAIAVRQDVA